MKKLIFTTILGFILLLLVITPSHAVSLSQSLSGKILLQVQEHGEAWYINPGDLRRYYLGRPADAFRVMRELGLGISEASYNSFNGYAPPRLSGKILLRVEASGEAYYVNPDDLKMYYLGRPADAFQIMRKLGLGITNTDLKNISIAPEEELQKEQACLSSGGEVSTSLCCKLTNDFPNLCLIGACGCSPENSHQVKICDCGPDKCFDGEKCVSSEELMTLEVFFSNSKLDPEFSCNKVFPVERKMSKTLGVARAALKELFKGLTEEEKNQGYSSWFSDITKDILKSIKIENNTAYVNLKDIRRIIPNASTSCGSAIFFAQVGTTLKQFPSVNRVIIAIDSKPSIFYEWIQIGCFEGNDFCDETPFKTSN